MIVPSLVWKMNMSLICRCLKTFYISVMVVCTAWREHTHPHAHNPHQDSKSNLNTNGTIFKVISINNNQLCIRIDSILRVHHKPNFLPHGIVKIRIVRKPTYERIIHNERKDDKKSPPHFGAKDCIDRYAVQIATIEVDNGTVSWTGLLKQSLGTTD